jgi:hypothetical protein
MADVLLDAHGQWDPSSTPAYALVPAGSKLMFFSENLKIFMASDQARQAILTAEPNQTVEGSKWAQNFTVSPVDDDFFVEPDGMTRKTPNGTQLLCTSDKCGVSGWHDSNVCDGVFADSDMQNANIYFVACRYVKLEEAGSPEYYAETGVNQRQVGVGYDGEREVSYELSNSGADMWLNEVEALATQDEVDAWYDEHLANLSPEQIAMVDRRLDARFPGWQAAHPQP